MAKNFFQYLRGPRRYKLVKNKKGSMLLLRLIKLGWEFWHASLVILHTTLSGTRRPLLGNATITSLSYENYDYHSVSWSKPRILSEEIWIHYPIVKKSKAIISNQKFSFLPWYWLIIIYFYISYFLFQIRKMICLQFWKIKPLFSFVNMISDSIDVCRKHSSNPVIIWKQSMF
jgi:hypothetical protein